ncbi:MAG: phosphoglycerate dehydrogenase [Propioniciclava sp.]
MSMILVTSRSFSGGDVDLIARVENAGHTVVRGPAHHDLTELEPHLAQTHAWIAGTGPITTAHLEAAPQLQVIARYGVGTEAVDITEARRRGVVVTNTPGANADAVADLAVGLMLSALRHLSDGDRRVRTGDWSVRRGRELGAATVGIIGFGRIGQGVARRVGGFGATVLAHDPFLDPQSAARLLTEPVELDTLFSRSDVISLHAPGGHVLVTSARLESLPAGSLIVNTARADLVDEQAVADALVSGQLGGYAADVLAGDTAAHDSPLLADTLADRVVLTPHLGAQTIQAVDTMGSIAVDNALAVLAGDPPPNPVTA